MSDTVVSLPGRATHKPIQARRLGRERTQRQS
jgi:hypothetical protein